MNKQPLNLNKAKHLLRDDFIKMCFITSLSLTLATVINFFLNVMLARYLIGEHYGDFAVAYRVLIIAGYILALGSNAAIKKFFPVYKDNDYWSHVKGLFRFYLKGLLYLSIFIILVGGAILALTHYFQVSEKVHTALLALLIAPLAALTTFFNGILSGLKSKVSQMMVPRITNTVLIGIVFIVIISFANITIAEHAIISCGIALLIICIGQITYLAYKLPLKTISASDIQTEKSSWTSFSFSYLTLFVIILLFNYSTLFLIEIFHFHEGDVGTFSAILVGASFLWIAPTAINSNLSVDIYRHLAKNEKKELQKKVTLTNGFILIFNLILGGAIALFSKDILTAFNPKFATGETAFIIMLLADLIYAFALTANTILRYGDLQKVSLYTSLFFLIMNILLSIPMIYAFGITGGACSYLICATLLSLSQMIVVKRKMGLRII